MQLRPRGHKNYSSDVRKKAHMDQAYISFIKRFRNILNQRRTCAAGIVFCATTTTYHLEQMQGKAKE
jgi:hypothetical protein